MCLLSIRHTIARGRSFGHYTTMPFLCSSFEGDPVSTLKGSQSVLCYICEV